MQMATGDSGTDGPLKLPATLDLAAAEDFLATVRARAVGEVPLDLDASGVEVLTLPCAQIILSAVNSHTNLAIRRPSAVFVTAFGDLGLTWPGDQDSSQASDADQNGPSQEDDLGQCEGMAENAGAAEMAGNGQAERLASGETADVDQAIAESGTPDEIDAVGQQQTDTPMSKRILTIDDSKTMRDMLLLTLTDAGFEVLQGVDGQDGLDVLGDQRVDVIITDINMPKMDGYEVIRQLRQNPRHKRTPILVLTTESDTEKRDIARTAGATGWMVKPFDPDGLIAVINKVSP